MSKITSIINGDSGLSARTKMNDALKDLTGESVGNLDDVDLSVQATDGQVLMWNGTTFSPDTIVSSTPEIPSAFPKTTVTQLEIGNDFEALGATVTLDETRKLMFSGATFASSVVGDDDDIGAVYAYRLIDGVWTIVDRIGDGASQDLSYGGHFGSKVSTYGNGSEIAIGNDDGIGVHIYKNDGNDNWVYDQYVTSPSGSYAQFGTGQAYSNDGRYLLIGDAWDGTNLGVSGNEQGAVFIFSRVSPDAPWTILQEIYAQQIITDSGLARPPSGMQCGLGFKVAISADGSRIAVCDYSFNELADGFGVGVVFIYEHNGVNWVYNSMVRPDEIVPTISESYLYYGFTAFFTDNDRLFVSSIRVDGDIMPTVYEFNWNGAEWSEVAKAVLPATSDSSSNNFGRMISLSPSGNTLVIGDNQQKSGGAVYIYKLTGGAWEIERTLTASGLDIVPIAFGHDVSAIDDYNIIVSDPYCGPDGTGAIVFYEVAGDARIVTTSDSIGKLLDVDLSEPATTGQALIWDGSAFVPTEVAAGIEEAPEDGKQYARQDSNWEEVAAAGIEEAPEDGKQYARRDSNWEEVLIPDTAAPKFEELEDAELHIIDNFIWVNGNSSVPGEWNTESAGTGGTFFSINEVDWNGNALTLEEGIEYNVSRSGQPATTHIVGVLSPGLYIFSPELDLRFTSTLGITPVDGVSVPPADGEAWVYDSTSGKFKPTKVLEEAPEDGKQYARQDGNWEETGSLVAVDTVTTPHTLGQDDSGGILTFNNPSAVTLNIPDGLAVGTQAMLTNLDAGAITVNMLGTDTIRGNLTIGDVTSMMSITKIAGTVWQCSERA